MSDADAPRTIVARYRTQPGQGERVAQLLTEYTALVRSEAACISFAAHRSPDDPDYFVLLECYRGQAGLDAHLESAHYAAIARDQIRPLLIDRQVDILGAALGSGL